MRQIEEIENTLIHARGPHTSRVTEAAAWGFPRSRPFLKHPPTHTPHRVTSSSNHSLATFITSVSPLRLGMVIEEIPAVCNEISPESQTPRFEPDFATTADGLG